MTIRRLTASVLSLALLLGSAAAAARERDDDERSKAKLYLPIAGTAAGGVTFAGTLSVQKFSQRNGKLVAIEFPVGDPEPGSPIASDAPVSVQQATTCQVLHLEVGAVNLNVLGLTVATQPISIDLSGVTGGTNVLGQLICTILETVGNVIGLVNLLNQLLGVLGGLTG